MLVSPRVASRLAYTAAATHVVAAAAMLTLLQPGLPVAGSQAAERLAYLSQHTDRWAVGWLSWHVADLALLAYYLCLASRWQRAGPIRCGLALLCSAAGLAIDLGAQAIYVGLAPRLEPREFQVAEAAAGLLTGYVANGLYTLAGVLLVWAGAAELPRSLLLLSLPVWIAGLWLSAASLGGSASGQFWSVALLMPSFVVWSGAMGRWLSRRAS